MSQRERKEMKNFTIWEKLFSLMVKEIGWNGHLQVLRLGQGQQPYDLNLISAIQRDYRYKLLGFHVVNQCP